MGWFSYGPVHHSQFRLRFHGRGEYAKLEVQRQAYDVKRPITESSRKRVSNEEQA